MLGLTHIVLLLLEVLAVSAGYDLSYRNDEDLTHFVTRPEIKAPLFNTTVYKPELVTPGYWFVAPYAYINQENQARKYYQACQTGPAIYDGSGELVWSGACQFENQNACDFRPFRIDGRDYLSMILYGWRSHNDTKGRGVILDDSYEVLHTVKPQRIETNLNMHEFNVLPKSRTVLIVIHRPVYVDLAELEEFGVELEAGWVLDCGFREVDYETGEIVFEWYALDHGVRIASSSVMINLLEGPPPSGWNYFHMNSVDKNEAGDYLVSSRYTDCVYKVSGQDGSIMWRLGGDDNDFLLEGGFNFSRQHDARFIEESEGRTVISLLDNASDQVNKTSNISSGLLLELETTSSPKVARVLRRWTRPDGEISHLRGNFQMLPNGNVFAGWSDNAVISEQTPEGEVVMTAMFASERFVSYRAWKHPFVGRPSEPPVLRTFAYGVTPASSTTVGYISWNGATEVSSWSVYRNSSRIDPVATISKDGFETMFQINGFEKALYVEALSAAGDVLGQSAAVLTEAPNNWSRHIEKSANAVEELGAKSLGIMSEAALFGSDLSF